jgi:hypothetical protein
MTEAERIKLTIILHQHTPAERLSAMEIRTILEFMEGRDYSITAPTDQLPGPNARENQEMTFERLL